jgi:peptide/nickel transport system permease protein
MLLTLLLRRLAGLAATLVLASLVVFTAMEILPGDPAQVILGTEARPDTLEALRQKLGLNRPATERYAEWATGLLRGDLGTSYTYSTPVAELVHDRVVVSLPLAIFALALTVALAIPLGVAAGARRNSMADLGIMGATQVGIAVPNFWFAMLLVLLFAITLRWVPAGGFPGWSAAPWPALRSLILPAVALALPQASILARVMRSSLLETLGDDYVRTARAKGLSRSRTLWGHALRNALIPVLTIMGLQFSFLLAGTIIIENVFYLPGLGRLVFQAINQRDLVVVRSVVMLLVASVVIVNALVDLAYLLVDPRLRRRS